MQATDSFTREFFQIFFANKRLIGRMFLAVTAMAALIGLTFPATYKTTGSIIVLSKKLDPPVDDLQAAASNRLLPTTTTDVETENAILKSTEFIRLVAGDTQDRGLDQKEPGVVAATVKAYLVQPVKDWVVRPLKDALAALLGADTQAPPAPDRFWEDLQSRMDTSIIPGTNVIELSLTYFDPDKAAAVTNLALERFLAFRRSIATRDGTSAFFREQKAAYQARLTQLEERKNQILKSYTVAKPDQEIQNQAEIVSGLRKEVLQLEDERLELELWIGYLQKLSAKGSSGLSPFPYDFQNADIQAINAKLLSSISEYEDARRVYRDDSPRAQALRGSIDDLHGRLKSLVKGEVELRQKKLEVINDRITEKSGRIQALLGSVQALKEAESELDLINTEQESVRETYKNFFRKYEESRIGEAAEILGTSNVQILAKAVPPVDPAFPRPSILIPFGMVAGLLLGIAVAFVREFLASPIRAPEHVEKHLGLPVIATIALAGSAGSARAIGPGGPARPLKGPSGKALPR